jgi:hypothetical protein
VIEYRDVHERFDVPVLTGVEAMAAASERTLEPRWATGRM